MDLNWGGGRGGGRREAYFILDGFADILDDSLDNHIESGDQIAALVRLRALRDDLVVRPTNIKFGHTSVLSDCVYDLGKKPHQEFVHELFKYIQEFEAPISFEFNDQLDRHFVDPSYWNPSH